MKSIIAVLFLFISLNVFSQNQGGPQETLVEGLTMSSFDNYRNSVGVSRFTPKKKTRIAGSVHIFDNWNNSATVVTKGNKFVVRNANFNALRNRFELKIATDSIYIFNFRQVDYIVSQDKKFVRVEFPEEERAYVVEELANTDDFSIYRKYYTEIEAGNPNPMRGNSKDKYLMKDKTFVKVDGKVERFPIKKKKVLKLMGDKASSVQAYAKEKDLNFKKDKDLKQIVTFYNSL